jgi:hypothetical protein
MDAELPANDLPIIHGLQSTANSAALSAPIASFCDGRPTHRRGVGISNSHPINAADIAKLFSVNDVHKVAARSLQASELR